MVQTIAPVVHEGDRSRWRQGVVLHILGATVSAAISGAALGAVGRLLGAPWARWGVAAVAVMALLYLFRELSLLKMPIPDGRRQVPEWWRAHMGFRTVAFMYGLGLGVGFLTHLRHGTLVVVAAAALSSGDPMIGAVLLAPFGIARGVVVLLAGSATTPNRMDRLQERLERWATGRAWPAWNGAALAALALVYGTAAVTAPAAVPGPGASGLIIAGMFAWASVAKLMGWRGWRESLAGYRLGRLERPASVAVPLAELSVPALVLSGRVGEGGFLALALLTTFTVAVLRAGAGRDTLPCACFGRGRRRSVRTLVIRNAALWLVALPAALAPGADISPRAPGPGEVLPAVLVAAAVGAAVILAAELRRMTAGR